MAEYGLGRNPSPFDARNWPVKRLLELIDEGVAVPVSWDDPVVLDQDGTPHCAGYTGAGYIATAQENSPANPTITNADGERIYYAAKVRDTQPGQENGTSIWQLAHVLKDMGVIDAYAFGGFADGKHWVQNHGPVPIGINWYSGMDTPDGSGLMHRTGSIRGGHAILWRAVDSIVQGAQTIRNSWGLWGFRGSGDAAILDAELAQLLDQENGDALFAVKFVKPVPPTVALPWPDFPEEFAADGFLVKESGLFWGYEDGLFRPAEFLQPWQVQTVIQRLCDQRNVSRLLALRMLAWVLKS